MNPQDAETIALNVLNFLVADEERLQRFMTLSGMEPATLRSNASDPVFLAGILDYLLHDESLIYIFAEQHNIAPEVPAQAHRTLVGRDGGDFN